MCLQDAYGTKIFVKMVHPLFREMSIGLGEEWYRFVGLDEGRIMIVTAILVVYFLGQVSEA